MVIFLDPSSKCPGGVEESFGGHFVDSEGRRNTCRAYYRVGMNDARCSSGIAGGRLEGRVCRYISRVLVPKSTEI